MSQSRIFVWDLPTPIGAALPLDAVQLGWNLDRNSIPIGRGRKPRVLLEKNPEPELVLDSTKLRNVA